MNFKNTTLADKLPSFLKMDNNGKKDENSNKKIKGNLFAFDFNIPLDGVEKAIIRGIIGTLILFIVYSGFSYLIKKQIDEKIIQAKETINNTNTQISLIDKDIQNIQNKTNEYTTKISNLQEINKRLEENNKTKKAIPILLNKLMYIMPDGVQIVSIQNTTGNHIEIQAQSKEYSQLGYLTTNIRISSVLTNVISTSGQKDNNVITIKIEGDLP